MYWFTEQYTEIDAFAFPFSYPSVDNQHFSLHLHCDVGRIKYSVADPGFPIEGCRPRKGDVHSRGGYVSKI